jgi:hypothetical protein
MTSQSKCLNLALVLTASTFFYSCALAPKKQYFSTPGGKTNQHRYITSGVAGSIITADGSIGVFALASVSMRNRGSLTLTFYRLTESREPLSVHKVRILRGDTMNEGREVRFNDSGVSNPVKGRFSYSSSFPAIPIQVEFSSGGHKWSREIELRHSIGPTYIEAIKAYPKAPGTVTEFRALQRPAAPDKPGFPATERP